MATNSKTGKPIPRHRTKSGAIFKYGVARNGNVWATGDARHTANKASECVTRYDLIEKLNRA